jgi:hypothetical protein
MMDNESLAVFLGLTEEEAAIIIPKLTAKERALYERMADVCADLNMGVIPEGVIVCHPRCGGKHI